MKAIQLDVPTHLELIESMWRVDLDVRKAKHGYYYLPDNFSEIMVILKGRVRRSVIGTRQSTLLQEGKLYMAPVRSKGILITAEEDVTYLLIKVHPQYQNAMLRNKAFETRNGVQEIGEGAWIPELSQTRMPNTKLVLQEVINFLEQQHTLRQKVDPVIEASISMIRQFRGEIKVKELNEELGVCKSTLEEKFNRNLGLSPKEFCKIEKINQFLDNYKLHKDEMTLTQLTFKSGYYDQSHLIKEFRYFVDLSPRKFLKEVNKLQLESTPQTRVLEGMRPAGFVAQTA